MESETLCFRVICPTERVYGLAVGGIIGFPSNSSNFFLYFFVLASIATRSAIC